LLEKTLDVAHQENMLLGHLLDFGITCVISSSYADIFYSNCFKNGILPIILEEEKIKELI
jgi:3-isopropylmalate dehydratase small subunit